MIVLFFVLFRLPLDLTKLILSLCGGCFRLTAVVKIAVILSHMNPVINPGLYAYHLKDFRRALYSFLKIKKTEASNHSTTTGKDSGTGRETASTSVCRQQSRMND